MFKVKEKENLESGQIQDWANQFQVSIGQK